MKTLIRLFADNLVLIPVELMGLHYVVAFIAVWAHNLIFASVKAAVTPNRRIAYDFRNNLHR